MIRPLDLIYKILIFHVMELCEKYVKSEDTNMKVITIANNKGGVGKTMQCYQLACHLANQGHKVLAIDLDSQANLSSTLGVNIQRTLIPEWLIGDIEVDEIIMPSKSPEGKKYKFHENLFVIPSSRHMANLAKLLILSENEVRRSAGRKERLIKLRLKEVQDQFDYVIIDTPPMLGDELIMSLVASDLVLIPTQAQDYSMDGLEELMDTFEIIKESENSKLEFNIIPSMVNTRRKIEQNRLDELAQTFNVSSPIRNLVDMQESISTKRPVFMMGKNSKGKKDYMKLWQDLGLH
jgi:chromosome partitioning protein